MGSREAEERANRGWYMDMHSFTKHLLSTYYAQLIAPAVDVQWSAKQTESTSTQAILFGLSYPVFSD